jgi:hypothetical protein
LGITHVTYIIIFKAGSTSIHPVRCTQSADRGHSSPTDFREPAIVLPAWNSLDGAVAELDRDPYLADKSVTPFPLAGWRYVSPSDDVEADDAHGVTFVCGRDAADWSLPPPDPC